MTANPAEPGTGPAGPAAPSEHATTAEGSDQPAPVAPAAPPARTGGAVRPPLPPASAGNLALFERLLPPLPPTPFARAAAAPAGPALPPAPVAPAAPGAVAPAPASVAPGPPPPTHRAEPDPAAGGPDPGWVARRLVAALTAATADERRRVAEAALQLGAVALARLAAVAEGSGRGPDGPVEAAAPGESFPVAVVRVLLDEGRPAPAAAIATVAVRDHADRLGTLHPDTAAMVGLLLDAHRRLDDDIVAGLLARNAELAATVATALGPDHPAALASVRSQDRLRALWSRRRLWQTPPPAGPRP